MSHLANHILNDALHLVQLTLQMLPDDSVRARVKRLLDNELSSLRANAASVVAGTPVAAGSLRSVADERHDEWAETVLMGARRILHGADEALYRLSVQAAAPTDWLERLTRHERLYATPKLPAFECSFVADRIIAGRNPLTERDAAWLATVGVTHVLDLREDWEWAEPRFGADAVRLLGAARRHLPIRDMQAPTGADLDAACQFLTDNTATPRNLVYMHCRAGQERTAAVLCAYVARRDGLSYDDALAVLKQRRPSLQPLPPQERAVRDWIAALGCTNGQRSADAEGD